MTSHLLDYSHVNWPRLSLRQQSLDYQIIIQGWKHLSWRKRASLNQVRLRFNLKIADHELMYSWLPKWQIQLPGVLCPMLLRWFQWNSALGSYFINYLLNGLVSSGQQAVCIYSIHQLMRIVTKVMSVTRRILYLPLPTLQPTLIFRTNCDHSQEFVLMVLTLVAQSRRKGLSRAECLNVSTTASLIVEW